IRDQNCGRRGAAACERSPSTRSASARLSRPRYSRDREHKGSTPASVGRADRHDNKTMELAARLTLLAKPFGNIGTDRFRGPPDLIAQGKLLDPREFEARPMHFQRQPVSPAEHFKILEPPCPLTHF